MLALQQYLKDFLVLIKKIQFYKLEFKTSCQQYPMSRERREESDESEPELDDPSSHDIAQRADTWFFKVIVRLDNGGDFSKVLNASKQQLERGLSTVSVISCLQYLKKTAKRLSLLQRDNFPNQHVQDMVWAWDIKLLRCSAS